MKFGMVDFDLKMLRLKRISNSKTENYSIVTTAVADGDSISSRRRRTK